MLKTILITGINGFLGSHLAKFLINHDYNIIGTIRNNSNLERIKSIIHKITLINIDEDYKNLNDQEISCIIHTATNYQENSRLSEICNSNLIFPLNLIDKVFNDKPLIFINCDTTLPKEINLYALSKNHFYDWLFFLSQKYNNFKVINCQIEQFYGFKDNRFTQYIFENLINNVKSIELTKGEQIRDFIYIDDLVNAILHIIKNYQSYPENFKNISIGNGIGYTIKEIVLLIKKICNNNITELIFGAKSYRENEPMYSVADITELKKLGWNANYTLTTGLKKYYKEYRLL